MKITLNESKERESMIFSLFFVYKIKQKNIANMLWISVKTIEKYVAKIKKKDLT